MMYSECCGAIVYDDYDLCSECLEHCDVWEEEEADDEPTMVIGSMLILEINKEKA